MAKKKKKAAKPKLETAHISVEIKKLREQHAAGDSKCCRVLKKCKRYASMTNAQILAEETIPVTAIASAIQNYYDVTRVHPNAPKKD